MRKMRLKSGAVGWYDIEFDGRTVKYRDDRWEKELQRRFIIIVEIPEKSDEIPKELYANAPYFDKIPVEYNGRNYYWARLIETLEISSGEITKCDPDLWFLFDEKHLTDKGMTESKNAVAVRKAWENFKCKLGSELRHMIYARGAEWCVAVRSECKERLTEYPGFERCPCLRAHPSSQMYHCLMSYLKSNNMMPDAEIPTTKLYKILGDG